MFLNDNSTFQEIEVVFTRYNNQEYLSSLNNEMPYDYGFIPIYDELHLLNS
jgi:hypothetical protein